MKILHKTFYCEFIGVLSHFTFWKYPKVFEKSFNDNAWANSSSCFLFDFKKLKKKLGAFNSGKLK